MTPEGKVKKAVKNLLDDTGRFGYIYSYWPVPGGYGKQTLDCLGCYRGRAFSIETKAPGEKPTARQDFTITEMKRADMRVFVIDGNILELEAWLIDVSAGRS